MSWKYCTIPYIVYNGNINLFYRWTWYSYNVTSEPSIWLLSCDKADPVAWFPWKILCLFPLFKKINKITTFQSNGFPGWSVLCSVLVKNYLTKPGKLLKIQHTYEQWDNRNGLKHYLIAKKPIPVTQAMDVFSSLPTCFLLSASVAKQLKGKYASYRIERHRCLSLTEVLYWVTMFALAGYQGRLWLKKWNTNSFPIGIPDLFFSHTDGATEVFKVLKIKVIWISLWEIQMWIKIQDYH